MISRLLAGCLLLALAGCQTSARPVLHLFAAASTKEAVEQIGRDFQTRTGVEVHCSCAASSQLARQIEQGADADLFLSADERWADYLAQRNLVEARRDLLGNHLVVIVSAGSKLELHRLADLAQDGVRRLALALEPVPAGRYARQALTKAGVWQRVEKRVREGGNVRAALTYVAREEADAGIVYSTDVAASSRVRIAFTIPDELHEPIRYPLVLVRRAAVRAEARQLYEYLGGETAAECFRRAGFEILH